MKITYKVALEIAHHESMIREAYKDSVGVWTWSIGITSMSGHSVERYIDNPQSIEKCLGVYIWLLEHKYAPAVRRAFKGFNLTEAQFAAALSFHWNTGAISRASWVKHYKAGRFAAAKKSFMAYNKPAEIIDRRTAERDLFFKGKWSSSGKITIFPVTSRHTPKWGGGKRVNIEKELRAALNPAQLPIPDHVPTTPKQPKPPQKPVSGEAAGIAAAITALGAAIYAGWDLITGLF